MTVNFFGPVQYAVVGDLVICFGECRGRKQKRRSALKRISLEAVCVLALLGSQSGLADQPVNISIEAASDTDRSLVRNALGVLRETCPAFQRAGIDLRDGVAKLRSGEISWKRDYGWDRMVEVEVVIADPPQILPTRTGSGYSGGHHCFYQIGSGDAPGLVTSKEVCKEICGWSDFFVSAPGLDGVLGHEPFKRDYDLDAIQKKARGGDYQAQRNLAYVLQFEKRDPAYDPVLACAWRKVILATAKSKKDESDESNKKYACDSLTPKEQSLANVRLQELLRTVSRKSR